jgi:hypothetical protein
MSDVVLLLNLLGVVGFVVLMGVLGRDRAFRYLSLNLLLSQGWSLVSCLYLTTSQYSFELGLTTHQNLAPLTLAFYNALFFLPMWWILRRLKPRDHDMALYRQGMAFDLLVLVVAGLAVVYLYQGFIGNGMPFFTSEPRQWFQARVYWTTPVGRAVSGSLGMLGLLLGVVTVKHLHPKGAAGHLLRTWAIGIVVALVVQQVLAGNKFSSLFWIAFFYGLPYLLFGDESALTRLARGSRFRRAVVGVLVVGGLYGSFRLARAVYERDVRISVASRVLVLQGQMWWTVHDRVFKDFEGNRAQLDVELRRLATREEQRSVGLWYLMERYADPKIVNSTFRQITGFTAGYPAIVLELFGPFGAVAVQVMIGFLNGLLAMLLFRFMAAGQYIRVYLAGTIYVLANSVFTMGIFEDLIKPTTVYKLVILGCLGVVTLLVEKGLRRAAVAEVATVRV